MMKKESVRLHWLIILLLLSACGSNTTGKSGPSLHLGPVTISAYINNSGEVSLDSTISIPLVGTKDLGVSWDVGFDTTLNEAKSKQFTLFILYQNSRGEVIQQEYAIDRPFEINFTNEQWVKKIVHDGNGNVVVYVEPNAVSAAPAPVIEPATVAPVSQPATTHNITGQWTIKLNVNGVTLGDGVTGSCPSSSTILYDFYFTQDDAGNLSGYYSLQPVPGLIDSGQDPFSGKLEGDQFSFTSSITSESSYCNGNINLWQGSIVNNQLSGTKTAIHEGKGYCCTFTGPFTGSIK
jgi:hypothetical protein